MKKRNQIESALLNDILSVANRAKPQTIPSAQTFIDDIQRYVEYIFELGEQERQSIHGFVPLKPCFNML